MGLLNENIGMNDDSMLVKQLIDTHNPVYLRRNWIGITRDDNIYPLPDDTTFNDGIISVPGESIEAEYQQQFDPVWGIRGFEGRQVVLHNVRGNFAQLKKIHATDVVRISGVISHMEGVYIKSPRVTLYSVYGTIKDTMIECNTFHLNSNIPQFVNCKSTAAYVDIYTYSIFEDLSDPREDDQISRALCIKSHTIEGRKYNTWKKLRALINNPKRYSSLMPDENDWLTDKARRDLPGMLGLHGFTNVRHITIKDCDVEMRFYKNSEGLWDVSWLKKR